MYRKNTVAKIGKHVASFADTGEPQLVDDCIASPGSPVQPRARGPPAEPPPQPVDLKSPDRLHTVREAADFLRCSTFSLHKWRLTGNGPKFVFVGRRVRYRAADLAAFVAASTRRSTSDPGEGAALTAA
jgi:hypothetical protein